MQRISDAYQRHHRFNTSLFGTVSKTPRERYSKLTKSDCLFDIYATIIEQYRTRFSTLDVGAKRYHPNLETLLHNIFVFFHFIFSFAQFQTQPLLSNRNTDDIVHNQKRVRGLPSKRYHPKLETLLHTAFLFFISFFHFVFSFAHFQTQP